MAKTPTTAPAEAVAPAPVEEPTTKPAPMADSFFVADPYAATLATFPNWPAVDPMEPAATVDLSTAPKLPTTPAQKA
jgi:hypothetical protein